MDQQSNFDIIIVGSGLVGAVMALSLQPLQRAGLRIAIADRQAFDESKISFKANPDHFDPRVSALTIRSQQILQDIDVLPEIEGMRHCPYSSMKVWDGEGTGSIEFDAASLGQAQLGAIVENSVILAGLHRALDKMDNLSRLIPCSLQAVEKTAQGISIQSAEGETYTSRLLIAADGANSRVRELMQFETREWDYQHTAIVTTVKTGKSHQDTAWQRFMSSGPLAFLPLRHQDGDQQNTCSIVWSVVSEQAEELMQLEDKAFCHALGKAFEHRLGEIQCCDRRFQVPLRQRHATTYFQEAVVLVGDAAHTIHPLAGQGVNLGLLDAVELAAQLEKGIVAGREIDDVRLLARYQRERKASNLSMMWMMEGFKHLFADQHPLIQWLRNVGLDAVNNFGVLKRELARRAMGLS